MASELEKVCLTLDKLTLDALGLIEQYIETKINLETSMSDGEAHLAKSRYIMGQRSVSVIQLPSEDSPDFTAIARLHLVEDSKLFGQKAFDLEMRKKPKDNEEEQEEDKYQDPLRWFGLLVPQDLHRAQAKYKQALVWCIESVNLQTQLRETGLKIKQLKQYKAKLSKHEE